MSPAWWARSGMSCSRTSSTALSTKWSTNPRCTRASPGHTGHRWLEDGGPAEGCNHQSGSVRCFQTHWSVDAPRREHSGVEGEAPHRQLVPAHDVVMHDRHHEAVDRQDQHRKEGGGLCTHVYDSWDCWVECGDQQDGHAPQGAKQASRNTRDRRSSDPRSSSTNYAERGDHDVHGGWHLSVSGARVGYCGRRSSYMETGILQARPAQATPAAAKARQGQRRPQRGLQRFQGARTSRPRRLRGPRGLPRIPRTGTYSRLQRRALSSPLRW